ncbi:MAG: tetratricopeptide repeat protein [Rhodopila sp.]|nr:tetratricopeptide repeat protein [Rhodopila sp.]
MSRKHLVFVCTEVGVGHLLTALLHSAYYAFKTDRTLAIDMRRFFYFRNNRHAEFLKHFGWRFPDELDVVTNLREVDRLVSNPGSRMIVQGDRLDINRPFDEDVVVVPCYTPGHLYTADRRQADTPFQITLRGALAERWEEAKMRAAWTGTAVGMHFRSMTGEFVERMNRYVIPDFDIRVDAIRDNYIDSARSLAVAAGLDDPAYFVASDDRGFIDYMRPRLDRVVTTGSQIPTRPDQSWAEHVAENNFDLSILADAVNDIWFLSECDAIVRSPHSAYSGFAILNSQKITSSRIVEVRVPNCAEIFASVKPEVAVNWTRVALREAQSRRVRESYPYQWFIDALERAGRNDEAQQVRKQATWQWEAIHSPAANVPGEQWSPGDLGGEKLSAAIAIVRRVAERLPTNPYVLAGYPARSLADLLAQAGRLDEAVAVAQRAVGMEPEDAHLWRHLGELLMKDGRLDEAERALRQAVGLVPDDGALFGAYALCLIKLDRMPEAIRMLRVAIALRPDRLQWRLELSRILVGTGAFDQAKAALMEGLPADARRSEVLNALSFILEKTGKRQEAADAISEACELEPHLLRWKYRLGELCLAIGDAERAIQTFSQILKIAPDSAHANHAISMLYQRQGRFDDALSAANRALAAEPEAPHRNARVGEVLMLRGELQAAEEALRRAVALRDESAETRFLLSVVMERLGRLPDALTSARRAAEIAPSDQRWLRRLADLSACEERPSVA